jgi:hypothetical protein
MILPLLHGHVLFRAFTAYPRRNSDFDMGRLRSLSRFAKAAFLLEMVARFRAVSDRGALSQIDAVILFEQWIAAECGTLRRLKGHLLVSHKSNVLTVSYICALVQPHRSDCLIV